MPGPLRVHIKNINVDREIFEVELQSIVSRKDWIFKGQTYTITIDERLYCKVDALKVKFEIKGKKIIITKGGL